MTQATEREDPFKNRVTNAARMLSACAGYFIDRVSFDAFAQEDILEVALREGPWKPDVVIELSNLHLVSVAKGPQLSGSFIDEISLIHLPKMPHPWPDDAIGHLHRFGGLSALAWLRIIGPAEVEAIASNVTVYTAMSDDEASAHQTT